MVCRAPAAAVRSNCAVLKGRGLGCVGQRVSHIQVNMPGVRGPSVTTGWARRAQGGCVELSHPELREIRAL